MPYGNPECSVCGGSGLVHRGKGMRFDWCACRTQRVEKGNKFRAEAQVVEGIRFASKREAARFVELKMLEREGVISGLKVQPVYPLQNEVVCIRYPTSKRNAKGRVARYTADFEYFEEGEWVTEDVKSEPTLTEAARLRMAVFTALYGRQVRIIG